MVYLLPYKLEIDPPVNISPWNMEISTGMGAVFPGCGLESDFTSTNENGLLKQMPQMIACVFFFLEKDEGVKNERVGVERNFKLVSLRPSTSSWWSWGFMLPYTES